MMERNFVAALALYASACLASSAEAADHLRISIQKTGTVSWEIALMKARGLDKAADLEVETTELASTDAGKVALEGGGADMIVLTGFGSRANVGSATNSCSRPIRARSAQ